MSKLWEAIAWDEYLYWQSQDKKTLKRIHNLIKDIERNGYEGIGKPEPLKHDWSGYWSAHIDNKNRLIFRIVNDTIEIARCESHYGDK